ncbi:MULTISPECIES: DUF4252 domain-containing protein [Prevotella]|uniref:DUF4252 domain-containing protein n=1 Tax=Prevotella melaninogenica TaxID=28132 RepID=A0ABX7XQR9_9BACT|nr:MULTISPECIES: DUF4252 domain-containing protein [Prevotella]QUB75462.1 DUF4252 domain-containing protein [Prevotella melaninogenica]
MKRILILFAFSISVLGSSAQSVEALFRQYKSEKNVEYIHIPRFIMSMAKMLTKAELEEAKALKAISSIRVLSLEECSPIVRQNFQKTLQTFHPSGYTPIIFSKEADETNYIYVKEKKGYIRELLILSADKQDGSIVHIKGRIKPEEVNTVVKQNTKKKLKEL